MARLSHGLLGALNLVTLLLSLPVLCAGVYIVTRATTACERGLQIPVVAFGCGLLLLSLVGLAGACGRRGAARPFLWVYVAFMFLLAVLVFAFAVFAFVVTHRGAGGAVSGRGYREYRLGDYSGWLQARIAEPETWRRVESCLSEARVCGGREFYRQHLSPIQSGCCKPPTWCRFRYVNATFWEAPRSGLSAAAASDGDCRAWSNDQQVLCFECDTCKAGVLETAKKKWKTVAIVNVSLLAFIVIVYTVGCFALRSKGGGRYFNGGGPDQT
ncbi:tetraspanin-8 [Zea mays]|uniref:Tetraspanin-11 n=1 Tax=Zea mays TaxID=4577 RepID=A0A1D6LW98_MAIZE|nr:tetraspanin-8 [Zea mays]AQK83518.1 Tetraspanin-11 [Zea mays]|eukprot:XP_008649288.1 tetraspanin-8 [Zea mays]